MRNKLILILLTVFVVGSIAGITAYNTISSDEPKKKAIITGEWNKGSKYVSGYVKDEKTGEPMPNANVRVIFHDTQGLAYPINTLTNKKGYYSVGDDSFAYGGSFDCCFIGLPNYPDYDSTYIILRGY